MTGLLSGLRIIEFQGIGPGPFCGMMLADHGAEVIRIDRPETRHDPHDTLGRSRRSIVIDTRQPDGAALARRLCASADAVIEGYRPGVMEKLGLGPEVLLADNPKLVYGRITGWGQEGPLAQTAGHDINYLAISGVLSTIGREGENPVPPVNYVADFGGGGMLFAFGLVAALLHVRMGGQGQVIDAAMTDGASLLAGMTWQLWSGGYWNEATGTNWLDSGAPFYDTYRCADGKHLAVGAIEPKFHALMLERFGLAGDPVFTGTDQMDPAAWPGRKRRMAEVIATRSRDEWAALFADADGCVSPVLSLGEAPQHPHQRARQAFVEVVPGGLQPAPAPRFSATPARVPWQARRPGEDTVAVLRELGCGEEEIARLEAEGAVRAARGDPADDELLAMMGARKRR
jgi:alpha-methylacyl-CoA racemase